MRPRSRSHAVLAVSARRRPADPVRVYFGFTAVFGFLYALEATLSLVLIATTLGFSPLQMVVVGTVLEAVTFAFATVSLVAAAVVGCDRPGAGRLLTEVGVWGRAPRFVGTARQGRQ